MAKLPSLTGKQLIAALTLIGFDVVRIKDGHHFSIDLDQIEISEHAIFP